MRNEMKMLNSFMPLREKEWEARLFIDEAIKNKAEYTLEAVARALAGVKIEIFYGTQEKPFEYKRHIRGDDDRWIEKTEKYLYQATMRGFVFHANTKIGIWLQVIEFWTEKKVIWPCGGAFLPNSAFDIKPKDDERNGESN